MLHATTMALGYAQPARAAAALSQRPAGLARPPRLRAHRRRLAVRAASDQPFSLENYQEAVIAE